MNTGNEQGIPGGPQDDMSGLRMGLELCAVLREAVGPEGFHGGVRPDNIKIGRGGALFMLGGPLTHEAEEFTPAEMEYMAPELFWNGQRSAAADVYSVGLTLYAVYNGGRLPFWPASGNPTANERATALQDRLRGEEIAPPDEAPAALTPVLMQALAFRREDRWQTPAELEKALRACLDGGELPPVGESLGAAERMMADIITGTRPAPKTKPAPEPEAKTKPVSEMTPGSPEVPKESKQSKKRRLSVAIGGVAVLVLLLALLPMLLRSCNSEPEPVVTDSPPPATTAPSVEPIPPTPSPSPTPTPAPTATPVAEIRYELVNEACSWEEAQRRCLEMGGHLAVARTAEEFAALTAMAGRAGLRIVWLGATQQPDGSWMWLTGEPVSDAYWSEGQPSGSDSTGAREDSLMLWYLDNDRGGWSFNDAKNDPVSDSPRYYDGRLGFICQYTD